MTRTAFLRTWNGLVAENRFHRLVLLMLVTSNLLTGALAMSIERVVVMVPPITHGPVEIARNQAGREVKEAWGLYLGELLGNVTPGSAEFIQQAVEPLLAATIRAEVIEVMARQVNDIKLDRITTSFDPRSVLYEPETDKVFVHGVQTSQGPGGRPQGRNRTYEFRIAFANYRPRITHIDVYGGEPKTLDRIENQPGRVEEQ